MVVSFFGLVYLLGCLNTNVITNNKNISSSVVAHPDSPLDE